MADHLRPESVIYFAGIRKSDPTSRLSDGKRERFERIRAAVHAQVLPGAPSAPGRDPGVWATILTASSPESRPGRDRPGCYPAADQGPIR